MNSRLVFNIINDMTDFLDAGQIRRLQEVLAWRLSEEEKQKYDYTNAEYLKMFLAAKKLEGCSWKTVGRYEEIIGKLLDNLQTPVVKITTEMIRGYLAEYQSANNCSKTTIDNIRRVMSSFFSWLEEEDYILKSPVRRIHKVKTTEVVREVIPDESIEKLRDGCRNIRDLAIIDFLLSSGVRVSELVELNKDDLNMESLECIVHGKGDKERKAYFDVRSKVHIEEYLAIRKDSNQALFASLRSPYERISAAGIEQMLRRLSKELKIEHLHPHKFRRTMATKAIYKGMPIEQVQRLLGHEQIDTTLRYAIVNQENVKMSHKRIMS